MAQIPILYNDAYDINVPIGHRFNGTKFSKLANQLQKSDFYQRLDFHQSSPVRYRDVLRTHAVDYENAGGILHHVAAGLSGCR